MNSPKGGWMRSFSVLKVLSSPSLFQLWFACSGELSSLAAACPPSHPVTRHETIISFRSVLLLYAIVILEYGFCRDYGDWSGWSVRNSSS